MQPNNQGYYPPPPLPNDGFSPPPYSSGPGGNAPPSGQAYYGQTNNQAYPPGGVYNENTVEANSFFSSPTSFSDTKIRHAFIRKVYSLVSLQLLCTFGFICLIIYLPPLKGFFQTNTWILWLLLIGTVVIMFTLACCESVARKYPLNLILLFVFTLMESLLIGCISSVYKTDTVLIAVGITIIVVVGLTLFAFQTKIDFTGFGTYLFVFGLVLFAFGFIAIIFRSSIMHVIYAALGAGLFSIYLVFDTQLMLGGKHKYSISPEDYVLAALNIYLDIINLFLMILRLVSAAKD
jgi:protein lifeguard